MEKRIKIVWILSLLSALVVIGVQAYWLYSQYTYVTNNYIHQIANDILAVGDEEYEIRKKECGGNFSYSINRNTEYANDNIQRKVYMAFSSIATEDSLENLTPGRKKYLMDSIMNVIKQIPIDQLASGNLTDFNNILDNDHERRFELPENKELGARIAKLDTSVLSLRFNSGLSEDSIVIGMNRAFINREVPFRMEIIDSLMAIRLPDIPYTAVHWIITDSTLMSSGWSRTGNLFSPGVQVNYVYSPFQQRGIVIEAYIPQQPLFRQMALQLLLSLGFVLLLIGCLIFQIKTILKQKKIGEMRQNFVNTMVHELKRPVQTLKTFVSFLDDKEMRSDEKQTEQVLQDSMFELDNLSAYLNKLKDMIRADDEMTPLHLTRFNLKELTDKVIRLIHIPQGKEVRFSTVYEMESPFIEADPIHVANVISNLIENAIKYSGKEVEIVIKARQEIKELRLSVSDNGIGIPLMEQDKVFAKFYRGSNMNDPNIPGLGLGLSYVKLISEAHQGHVFLKSNINKGTTVTLCIPQ